MILNFLFIFCVLCVYSVSNKENSCGCNVNRNRQDSRLNNVFYNVYTPREQCKVSDKTSQLDFKTFNTKNLMVLIPEGTYQIGTDEGIIEADSEGPKRLINVKSFYLDKFEVSNRDFRIFTQETNYKTEAEVFGDSFVFTLFLNETLKEQLMDFRVMQAPWWYKVNGTNWKYPNGPDSNLAEKLDHPVTHISWNDAQAYCAWRGGRLPTEAEWEAACRGGHKNTKYPWGDKLYPNKIHMTNIWQGTFPNYNSAKDGYIGTSPVDAFPPNDFGLYNMAGNVWEWTQDSWSKNNVKEKVKKGGSYLCHRSYCYRYRCSARSHNTDDSSAGNLGFRCAKSV